MTIELRFEEWVELRRGLLAKVEEVERLQEHYSGKLEDLPPDIDTDEAKTYRKRLLELAKEAETYSKVLMEIEMHKF